MGMGLGRAGGGVVGQGRRVAGGVGSAAVVREAVAREAMARKMVTVSHGVFQSAKV